MLPGIAIILAGHAPEFFYIWLACGAAIMGYLWHGLSKPFRSR